MSMRIGFCRARSVVVLLFASLLVACGTKSELGPQKDATPKGPGADFKPYSLEIPGAEIHMDFVPVQGGMFMLGSAKKEAGHQDDEGPQREVTVKPFWMAKTETTWDAYELWMLDLDRERRKHEGRSPMERDKEADAVTRPTKPYVDMTFEMGHHGYPAISMTQRAARTFCVWLSAKTGHEYRLPTEAEWEHACRAGTTTAFSFGDDKSKIGDYAWFEGNSEGGYQKVGTKKANPWGLHDMHGNVAEWVLDQYGMTAYAKFEGKDPLESPWHKPTKLYPRVARGGSYEDVPLDLRSARRIASHEDWKMQDPQLPQSIWYHADAPCVGFRVIRSYEPSAKKYELVDEPEKMR